MLHNLDVYLTSHLMMKRGLTWIVMDSDDGLSNTGFTLSETTSTSGIFTGTFQIPANYCTNSTGNTLHQPPLVKTWKSTMLTIQTPLVN